MSDPSIAFSSSLRCLELYSRDNYTSWKSAESNGAVYRWDVPPIYNSLSDTAILDIAAGGFVTAERCLCDDASLACRIVHVTRVITEQTD